MEKEHHLPKHLGRGHVSLGGYPSVNSKLVEALFAAARDPQFFSKTMGLKLKVQDSLRLLDTGMTAIIPVAASAAMVGFQGARWTKAIEILNKVPWVWKFEPKKPTEKLHILSLSRSIPFCPGPKAQCRRLR